MSCKADMLNHLASRLPSEMSATADTNDYATPSMDLMETQNKGETRLAHKFFDQIQGAEDGQLVQHHGRGKRCPDMK